MALEYVVTKRVFGFDKEKNEKYVPKSVRSGKVNFTKMCRKVSELCGVHRKVVDLVVTGLVDKMAEDIDDGKSVQLGDFGIFTPTICAKSSDNAEDVSAKSIVRRKILFYPGKIIKSTLEDMSVTRRTEPDTDYTNGSRNNGGSTGKPDAGGDDNGESPDPTL
ncbi:HU family DNA-binding protein [Bacteroides sp.]|uniref:HU family DNA-binding protein n=1 Tax=Bacteroides sp. TaxID=29523 RepID=UPI0026124C95|nr:HU family DNA-binding protein [Bacteroides sp.]MDD3036575.1 DNA-binding protein [Bacteroides sp.]